MKKENLDADQQIKNMSEKEIFDRYHSIIHHNHDINQLCYILKHYNLTKYETNFLIQRIQQECTIHQADILLYAQQNQIEQTSAMYLAQNNILIPKQLMHDYNIKNVANVALKELIKQSHMPLPQHWKDENEMTIFDQAYFGIIPKITNHQSNEQDQDGFTVAMLLALNQFDIPECWHHKPELQNVYGQTVAMLQAKNGIIPDQYQQHDPLLNDIDNHTVEDYLVSKNLDVPQQWQTNPDKILTDQEQQYIQQYYNNYGLKTNYNISNAYNINKDKNTIAMYLADQGITPPMIFMHNNILKNKQNETLKQILEEQNLPVPQHWNENCLTIFDQACYKIIPDITGHNPEEQDENGWTVAMILAFQNVFPPQQWFHSYDIKNKYNKSLKDYLQQNNFPIPQHINDNMTIFDQACFGIIPNIINHQPQQCNNDKWTVAMILAFNKVQIPKEWEHNPTIKNKYNQTVALYMVRNNIETPLQWRYEQDNINDRNMSFFDICVMNKLQPPQWCCRQPEYQDENGNTQAMILAKNNIDIPEYLHHETSLRNNDKETVAMIQAQNGKIPDKQWHHNKYLRFETRISEPGRFMASKICDYSVQNILSDFYYYIPDEWRYNSLNRYEDNMAIINAKNGIIPELGDNDPLYTNVNGYTVANALAQNGIIPPKEWMYDLNIEQDDEYSTKEYLQDKKLPVPQHQHDDDMTIFDQACFRLIPNIKEHKSDEQDEDGFTVAMILAINNIEIPKEWEHKPEIQNKYGYTVAIYQAQNGIIPDKQWHHNPILCNEENNTVAVLLADQNIIPPKQWMYDVNLKINDRWGLKKTLQYNELPVPNHLSDNNMNIFDQACFGIIPQIDNHIPEEQDEDGWTVAMILTINNLQVPKEWYHNPSIQNTYGQTVAYLQAQQGIIPDKQWIHNKYLRFYIIYDRGYYYTIQNILQNNNMDVPDEWKYTPLDGQENNQAMMDAEKGIIPKLTNDTDPYYKNIYGDTVASILIHQKIIPPKEWVPNPSNQDNSCKLTVAMKLALHNLDIPDYCYHDPLIHDSDYETVAMRLADKGIIPPNEWMHDVNLKSKFGSSIKSLLDNQFILNCQTYIQNKEPCQICFSECNNQQFVKTTCNHQICLQCFTKLAQQENYRRCPICNQYDWFQKIIETE